MGILEEIKTMRQSGLSEEEIISKLQEQGNSYRAISEAISQSKIKQAVEGPEEPSAPEVQTNAQNYPMQEDMQQTSPPTMNQEPQNAQQNYQNYEPPQQEYAQQNYDYSPSSLSTDTIMEISEQIVSEKLLDMRKKIEKISSFKTDIETKTESIDERLKRIEKIIDTLQTSVLKKVGDYVTNVEDIKHELIETQKTFAKALGSKHHKEEHKHHN